MATLTDEQKAKLVAGDVEGESSDETTGEQETTEEEEQSNQEVESQAEETTEEESQEEAEEESTAEEETPTFTKQFPNLKGDKWEDYGPELEKAYVNSTNEALRLKKQLDDSTKLIDEAKAIIAGQQTSTETTTEDANKPAPTQLAIDSHPDVQYAKQLREKEMISAFDEFAKAYPQARETEEFNRFTAASNGVAQGYAASHNGASPTYPELFQGIAAVLGWQPAASSAKKDNAIVEAASSSQTVSSTQPSAKRTKVTDAEVDVYLKMFSSKTRAEAIKELSEVKI